MQKMDKYGLCYLLIILVLAICCKGADPLHKDTASYIKGIQEWHRERLGKLKAENGVLSVTGLFWLKEGENRFGSDSTNDIVLPGDKSPDFIGSFILDQMEVRISVNPGVKVKKDGKIVDEMVLNSDADSNMTTLSLGDLNWFIIERNGEFGVRFRDNKNTRMMQFKGIETYKVNPDWKFKATFEPYEPVKTLKSVTASGAAREFPSTGALVFKMKSRTYRLDPVTLPDMDHFLVIFGDKTNGIETYGGGRFLYVEKPGEDNTTILDFNKSINPPCAISEYFACPLPPIQNKLPFEVTAGEKKYNEIAR